MRTVARPTSADAPRRRLALFAIAAAFLPAAARAPPSPADFVTGTIIKIDGEAGTITLQHEAIRHLYLPAGTTRFRYVDPWIINGRRPGDVVRFRADRIELVLRVTHLFYIPR